MWLASKGYTIHLLVAAIVAPLLLLRTDASTSYAFEHISKFRHFSDWLRSKSVDIERRFLAQDSSLTLVFVGTVFVIGAGSVIGAIVVLEKMAMRVWATIRSTVLHPVTAFRSIPRNWVRVSMCTDICHVPEVMPGYAVRRRSGREPYGIAEPLHLLEYDRSHSWLANASLYLVMLPLIIAACLPSVLYRFSLKGSSVLYLPLLWVAHVARREDIWGRLKEIRELAFFVFRRWFGLLVIGFVASKVLFQSWWRAANAHLQEISTHPQFIELFVAPVGPIPRWQLAAAANAVIAWVVFFLADRTVVMSKEGEVGGVTSVVVRLLWSCSAALSLYTILITIYNVWSLQLPLPEIGDCWTPWCGDLSEFLP